MSKIADVSSQAGEDLPAVSNPKIRWSRLLPIVLFCLYFAAATGIQSWRGSFESSLAEFPDEPAHAVTGQMLSEYLTSPKPLHPLRFAENFYVHYPKVGIGNWPPAFYGVQGVWMRLFGVSRNALLLLMSFLTALMATLVYAVVRSRSGFGLGLMSGAALLSMPMVQRFGGAIMTEIPVALFTLGAAISFARYLESEKASWSLAFGVLASCAILTKGNAFMLALMPPLALLLHGGKWHLLKKPGLWLSAAPVIVFCLPWYAMTLHISQRTWGGTSGVSYFKAALKAYSLSIPQLAGVGIAALALVGLLAGRSRPEWRAMWASLVSIVPALLILHCVVPSSIEDRHLVPACFVIAILFGLGASTLGRLRTWAGPAAAAAALLITVVIAGAPPRKDIHGYEKVAGDIVSDRSLDDAVMLIASDSIGEGAFVSEVALQAGNRKRIVLRATKVLVKEDWSDDEGKRSKPLVQGSEELIRYMRAVPVAVIVLDTNITAARTRPFHKELREVLDSRPDLFEVRATYASRRQTRTAKDGLRVYVLRDHRSRPKARIDLDLVTGKRQP